MGTAGASSLWWQASTGDANGPNACNDRSDDIEGCSILHQTLGNPRMKRECMTCWEPCPSYQATPRGKHIGGVMTAFADSSIHFISNFVETSGEYGGCCRTWDYFILAADGFVVDPKKLTLND